MFEFLAKRPFFREFAASTLTVLCISVACAIVIIAVEVAQRRDMGIYRSPNALNDLAYGVFYKCSIYNILALALFAFLVPRLQFLRIGLLLHLSSPRLFLECRSRSGCRSSWRSSSARAFSMRA